ncbi:hypothetical protein PLEOSDRAFT_1036089 [Pleurotus ostreatus PC15]|uniref:Guanine nucleotide-binding protein-like 1 n=1 Tax=Pleurotus ostreatus (strain PC15) TaxID=1137138 RepID=A0A067NSN8_PLEO1|nr:hypothetical protein PLEOSDRAFT_1036089 [Pleurotus ostreatus PC15]
MPRKKITNINQKKTEQKLKRAAKRGDIPPLEPKPPKLRHPEFRRIPTEARPDVDAARKLQSAFVKLPREYLDKTKLIASQLILPRPIPGEAAVFPSNPPKDDGGSDSSTAFTCPKRPKWRFDMSKVEVEANENGVFRKWLAETDHLIEEWRDEKPPTTESEQPEGDPEIDTPEQLPAEMPRSWCYFERNPEVWRQLWRVTEISQIILVLLDSRCPLLHYPPSLRAYLATHKVILVLTKVDLSGPERTQAWTTYLQSTFPGVRVTHVESYIEKKVQHAEQGRKHYEPHIPTEFRRKLVEAIRDIHAEMLKPPAEVKKNEAWAKRWTPPVKQNIDWDAVLSAQGGKVGSEVGGAVVPLPAQQEGGDRGGGEASGDRKHVEPEFLTVGVIGQPNVGKSSLLNALFGVNRVRTSKQPGKTKHYQTLFWTNELRLVDCPGLVMPNNIPMEMQVLSGVLPISRVSAIPACIYFSSQRIPLEKIFNLSHPTPPPPPGEDKRTWREGSGPHPTREKPVEWTALDILIAYAGSKGWVTAKAGRPDMNRAGNDILRALVEGRIAWAFWPPGTDITVVGDNNGNGIWLHEFDRLDAEFDDHEEDSAEQEDADEGVSSDINSEGDGVSEDEAVGGRFDALSLEEESEEEEVEEEEKEEDRP